MDSRPPVAGCARSTEQLVEWPSDDGRLADEDRIATRVAQPDGIGSIRDDGRDRDDTGRTDDHVVDVAECAAHLVDDPPRGRGSAMQRLGREAQAGNGLGQVGSHTRDRSAIPDVGADEQDRKDDQRDDDAGVHRSIVALQSRRRSGPSSTAWGIRRITASVTTAPASDTITGLRSSSVISG